MLLVIFLVIAVASSVITAEDCFDGKELVAKIQPVHKKCQEVVKSVKNVKNFDYDFAYYLYRGCHNKELDINNKYQEFDQNKFVNLFKSLSTNANKDKLDEKLAHCEKEIYAHGGNVSPYLDCLTAVCPELKLFREDFHNSAKDIAN